MSPDRIAWFPDANARPAWPVVALVACAAYYTASVVGLQLRIPPATPSVLWPPNAVLASILVLTSPRWWPAILLAVLPVHVFIQWQTDWPRLLILALFVTNCTEAILAAGGLHLLSDVPWRFDTLRRLVVFLCAAVIAAPVVSSFADAGAVWWFRGESYWDVWQTRTLGNMLAELTVVPSVVGLVAGLSRWRRGQARPRWTEAALLAFGLVLSGTLSVAGTFAHTPTLQAVSIQMPLVVQLPFLLWAAMRFGPTGSAVALLTSTGMSVWAVVHGIGPLVSLDPRTTVSVLTLSLIVVATTLMILATLVEERRQTQQALKTRLEFEGLLSGLSTALVQSPSDGVYRAFETWLCRIAGTLHLRGLTLFVAPASGGALRVQYAWIDPAERVAPEAFDRHQLDWAHRSVASLRPAIGGEPSSVAQDWVGGAVPLVGDGQCLGALAFGLRGEPAWPENVLGNLQLVVEVLANALGRKRSEDALRESEGTKSAILDSLANSVAVLDRRGCLIQVNDQWHESSRPGDWMAAEIGADFLASCRLASPGHPLAQHVLGGVSAILEGSPERFVVEHREDTGRWWSFSAAPLDRPGGGAVLMRTEITERRRAEIEAQRSRQELAHVSRVSMMGEVAVSVAHQLNQPLAAIMTNAQAGVRIMDAARPDFAEIRKILVDIVSDDRRASEVIQHFRELLRKGELDMKRVDLGAAIREVVDLLKSEAISRKAAVKVDGAAGAFVQGDRMQLQQAVLNLLHNAFEAMADQSDRMRTVAVAYGPAPGNAVQVSVRDSGPGLRPGTEALIFEPFYTTKAGGMGMGLSIVRSIVEAHGGSIHARQARGDGAIFDVLLPAGGGRLADGR